MTLAIVATIIAAAIVVLMVWNRYRFEKMLEQANDPKTVREYLRHRYTIDN